MKKYILDIETEPQTDLIDYFNLSIKAPDNYKSEEAIAKYVKEAKINSRKKMSVDTDYCDIIMLGIKEVGGESAIIVDKQQIASKIKEIFEDPSNTIITFNGKKFDLPAIIKWGIKNDFDLPYKQMNSLTTKYSSGIHIDLQEALLGYGDYKSLDELAMIYLGKGKKEIDFNTCSREELSSHCHEDLLITEQIYNKFLRIF